MPQGGNTILGRWYEPSGSPTDTLAVIRDKLIFTKAADDARLLVITDIQGLSDTTRQAIAGSQDLADFDAGLEAEEWEIRDRLDYYSYPTRTENLTVADGAWFSPDSVDSFCGEHATNVASNTVDGNTGTFWQHFNSHTHNITFKLRDWPKKVTKIRFFYGVLQKEEPGLSPRQLVSQSGAPRDPGKSPCGHTGYPAGSRPYPNRYRSLSRHGWRGPCETPWP